MSSELDSYRKYDAAAQLLRKRIVEGRFPPGSRLPTQRDLSGELSLSPVTLQKATNQLAREGFLRAMGSRGTFVADHPPHLCRYAIAFPSWNDGVRYWTDFWTILLRAAEGVSRADRRTQFVPFFGITGHSDVEDYQRLMADAHARRIAGIILLAGPHLIWDSSLLNDCPVPRVYIGGDVWEHKIPCVSTDVSSFFGRALEFALVRGRRRPVVIGPSASDVVWSIWRDACERNGITPARRQVLSVPLPPDPGARSITQVLMQLPPEARPDVLVVADDHFVGDVTDGLLATGLPESDFPLVIAQTNFPKVPRGSTPVTCLGFDSTRIIRSCLDVLESQRRGEEPQPVQLIPAAFSSELPKVDGVNVASFNHTGLEKDYATAEGMRAHAVSERNQT